MKINCIVDSLLKHLTIVELRNKYLREKESIKMRNYFIFLNQNISYITNCLAIDCIDCLLL